MAACYPVAENSPPSSPASIDVLEILSRLQSVGFCLDPLETGSNSLGDRFERVVSVFHDEIARRREIRPLPALIGDGRHVDLFRLYRTVREKGRYGAVTAARAWGSVASGLGLDPVVGSAVKLVYRKYLDELDRWLQKVLDKENQKEKENEEGKVAVERKEEELSLCEVSDGKVDVCEVATPSSSKREQLWTPPRGSSKVKHQVNGENGVENGDENYGEYGGENDGENGGDDDVVVLEPEVWCEQVSSLKRKRKALFELMKWVREVARSPGDPSRLQLERCKSDGAEFKEFLSQALLARDAMFLKRIHNPTTNGSLSEKRLKIHCSFYDNYADMDPQTNEKLRFSQRILSLEKQSCPGSRSEKSRIPGDVSDKRLLDSGPKGNHDKGQLEDLTLSLISGVSSQDLKHIPVGPSHQARVPEWTGMSPATSGDSDYLKWLGTRIWPPEAEENKLSTERYPIGKGRQDACCCERRGSVECIRFHVAEKRLQLKCELGSAFYSWRFDCMGEEVALSWTEEEERKFKSIVLLNPPSLNVNFWDQVYLCFPSKRRRSLVSYYFNVFLLRWRSYQNRVTPNNIDSDDDEDDQEFGFLSKSLGYDAVKVKDSESIFCAQNAQCMDLDD